MKYIIIVNTIHLYYIIIFNIVKFKVKVIFVIKMFFIGFSRNIKVDFYNCEFFVFSFKRQIYLYIYIEIFWFIYIRIFFGFNIWYIQRYRYKYVPEVNRKWYLFYHRDIIFYVFNIDALLKYWLLKQFFRLSIIFSEISLFIAIVTFLFLTVGLILGYDV